MKSLRSHDKAALLNQLIEAMEADHARLVSAAKRTHKAATHEEARPENDKDTRALESSYLARGQAQRVEMLGEAITRLKFISLRSFDDSQSVDLTALVRLEADDGSERMAFLLPEGGGYKLETKSGPVSIVTPQAPLGRQLLGKQVGDDAMVGAGPKPREYTLEEIC